jgi:Na+-transporting methylmalonyl-CoA/oxaloacetate decarboxylase gamma subunit
MGKILKLFLKNKSNIAVTLLLVVLGIGMVILVPLVLIFALRLLGVEIQYSIGSWFGALIVLSMISANPSKKEK